MYTGPTTPAGKQISAMNSLKHGLTARQTVLPGENREEFDSLVASLRDHYQPDGPLELEVCDEVSATLWRLQRARAHEALALQTSGDQLFAGDTPAARGFDRLLRYLGSIERQFNRAVVRLQQLQAERRKLEKARRVETTPEPEFVSSRADFVPPHPVEVCEAAMEEAFSRLLEPAC